MSSGHWDPHLSNDGAPIVIETLPTVIAGFKKGINQRNNIHDDRLSESQDLVLSVVSIRLQFHDLAADFPVHDFDHSNTWGKRKPSRASTARIQVQCGFSVFDFWNMRMSVNDNVDSFLQGQIIQRKVMGYVEAISKHIP